MVGRHIPGRNGFAEYFPADTYPHGINYYKEQDFDSQSVPVVQGCDGWKVVPNIPVRRRGGEVVTNGQCIIIDRGGPRICFCRTFL